MDLLLKYLSHCFFINSPADVIPPKSFMWKNVLFYLVSGMIVEGLISDPADGTLEVILRTIMAFSTVGVILIIQKKWYYYNQLYTAIFVCENFIMTLATATEGLYHWMVIKHMERAEEVSVGVGIVLVLWYIVIISYIFRQLLEFKMSSSIIMAFSYFVLTYGIPMLFMDI
ncbi:MAG: hypothetical protein ACXWTH_03680 [Methylosarcina sp.]|jgi:hypothetical protein